MPVLLAPEQTIDMHHPVFKMTITIRNESPDGVQVYPYVYIRVMFLNGIPTAEILPFACEWMIFYIVDYYIIFLTGNG